MIGVTYERHADYCGAVRRVQSFNYCTLLVDRYRRRLENEEQSQVVLGVRGGYQG